MNIHLDEPSTTFTAIFCAFIVITLIRQCHIISHSRNALNFTDKGMVLQYICGGCNKGRTSPVFTAMHCGCGYPHRMLLLCANCKDVFWLPTEYTEHIGQCNRCAACGIGGLGYVELVQHIAPGLFRNQNLRPVDGRVGPCFVLHGRNPFAANN